MLTTADTSGTGGKVSYLQATATLHATLQLAMGTAVPRQEAPWPIHGWAIALNCWGRSLENE